MSTEPISMRKFKDVLRLKHEAGLSQRQIASALHLSLGVVNKYLNAAQAAGITWPPPEDLSETQLRRRLFLPDASPSPPTYAQPDFAVTHQELKRKGMTRQLLWEEYAEVNPDNHYQYAQFCFHYHQWRARLKLSMRQTHRAGEKMFVDYAGQTVPVINSITGEIYKAQIFVAVLGASNYTYAEATLSQQIHDWIGSHVRALDFFGGVPQLIIPDNLKSGVTRPDRYEPTLNRSYQEMLEHYSTAALPARPRKPKDKSKVENAVLVIERWVLARLRQQTFFSFADLNRAIKQLIEDLNTRPFKKLPGSRRSQYEALDLPALGPLPGAAYQFALWKQPRVAPDYHVEVDGHYYSVPHSLVTLKVDVRLTATTIECFHQNQRVASHSRVAEGRGGHTTIAEHMPSHHRAQSEWNPGRFLNWAVGIGPDTRDNASADARITQAPGVGLSLLLWLALSGQALFTRAIGSGVPTRIDSWGAATIECSDDPRTRTRFAAFAGIRTRSGHCTARSRERSRRGLLSMTCIATREKRRANARIRSAPFKAEDDRSASQSVFQIGASEKTRMANSHAGIIHLLPHALPQASIGQLPKMDDSTELRRITINVLHKGESGMLNQQTLQSLRALRLPGMADAFAQQLEQPQTQQLSFEERVAMMVDRERTHRENRRLRRLLHSARLKQQACVEEIDYQAKRGLVRSQVAALITCEWVCSHQNMHITGPTGTGKSWIACAFGQAACRQGLSVRYERTGRLLDELRIARGDGSYSKNLRQLAKLDLLILDDFGIKPLSQNERHDLLEIIEDRHANHSTIITSQLPISSWHAYLNEPTVADALLDRLLANAHRLELKGESLRKTRQKLTDREHSE